ncbi:hypothetical protein [Deinococcus ficus]|uniref:Uncharacterized protein n=1 Tax=Deinococcus ficus TaxID=317577 RepID=A0A221T3G9_9DEIO|nr:hypothetical protein [Deinococcus ficus]ASN83457.1 hypothetical protein DFI_19865 [Deinococcus ficus]
MHHVHITVTALTPEDLREAAAHAVTRLQQSPDVPECSDAHGAASFTLSPHPPGPAPQWELLERHEDTRRGPQYRCIGRFESAQDGLDALRGGIERHGLKIIDVSDDTVHVCSEREILWMLQRLQDRPGLHVQPDWAYAAQIVRQERARPDHGQCRVLTGRDRDGTVIRIVRQDTQQDVACWRGSETQALLSEGELDADNLTDSALSYAAVLGLIKEPSGHPGRS